MAAGRQGAAPHARQAAAEVAPEEMAQLPEIPQLSEEDKTCLRYGLKSVAPGFLEKQPLQWQLASFYEFCTAEVHMTRDHDQPLRAKSARNIMQTIKQIFGYNYKHNMVSSVHAAPHTSGCMLKCNSQF